MSAPTIASLVTELAVQTSDGIHDGPSLLSQLREAVWGSIGKTVSGAEGAKVPMNIGAHILWVELGDEIEGAFSGLVGRRGYKSPWANLWAWHSTFALLIEQGKTTDLMESVALERLRGWVQKIRDQFDAPLNVPLRDFNCPNCGDDRAEWWDTRLETVLSDPAIVINLNDRGELVATCRNAKCTDVEDFRSRWTGDAEVLYMARRAGIDVDALAAEIRVARMPQPEVYVPPDSRVIVFPEDPAYAAHIAALSGEAS